jgi:hypothetical protein
MTTKLAVLGFSLITALSGTALAHDGYHGAPAPTRYDAPARHEAPARYGAPVRSYTAPYAARSAFDAGDLRRSDLNRDGRVTLPEAMIAGRSEFQQTDRDHNGVLTARELSFASLRQDDRNRDGRVSYAEYESGVRQVFARSDFNHDGRLGRGEFQSATPWAARSPGWQR